MTLFFFVDFLPSKLLSAVKRNGIPSTFPPLFPALRVFRFKYDSYLAFKKFPKIKMKKPLRFVIPSVLSLYHNE